MSYENTNPRRHVAVPDIIKKLEYFSEHDFLLKGLKSEMHFVTFAKQIADSIRRIEYVEKISPSHKKIHELRADPNSEIFDPLRAAYIHLNKGEYDEACWNVFLATHFGKNISTKWQLCRDIYSGLRTEIWSWYKITDDFVGFEKWYNDASQELVRNSTLRQYGNHRKYETLKANSKRSIPKVFRSYLDFIGNTKSHEARFEEAKTIAKTPEDLFSLLYSNMNSVLSFGRTAKFDYLTMLKKISLLDVEPGHLFLRGSTGPVKGCRLLFNGDKLNGDRVDLLDEKLKALAEILDIPYLKMQVLEDSLCNWQKSPSEYLYFGG